jgi:hypothetical protein
MRSRIAFVLVGIALVCGCTSHRQLPGETEYQRMREGALASSERCDTLVLGFHFGMGLFDCDMHTLKLAKAGTVTEQKVGGRFSLTVPTIDEPLIAAYSCAWYESKLADFTVVFTAADSSVAPRSIKEGLLLKYEEEFGPWYEVPGYTADTRKYVAICGNRQVEIVQGLTKAFMFFTDIRAVHKNPKAEDHVRKTHAKYAREQSLLLPLTDE